MNANCTQVKTNPERGYSEHMRTWIMLPQEKRGSIEEYSLHLSETVAAAATSPSAPSGSSEDQPMELQRQPQERKALSAEPGEVLLNLLNVTQKIFGYLPLDSLRACTDVCRTFNQLAELEIATRNRTFILARKIRKVAVVQDLLGQLIMRQYDHFLCEPRMILIMKARAFHPKNYAVDPMTRVQTILSSTSTTKACWPKDLINHGIYVGDGVFYSYPGGVQTGCSFAAMQIPRMPVQRNNDHAIRIGHFRWMEHCMDDIAVVDLPLIGMPGFLFHTNSTTLGCPEVQIFDHPLCAVTHDLSHVNDECYVFCGSKTKTASIWLDHQALKGQPDLIRSEFEKINPPALAHDAHDIFGLYFTTAPPLLNHTDQEVAVLREFFPSVRLMGCSLTDSLFGNTASSVRVTSPADRAAKVSHATGHASASVFFLVVVST
ncbi:hypothetical protein BV898_00789 [Hypsibius exemplaris]|uniref:F-box domain-containing protein n=1 Tax=Hypsibius exemplaris TaxID=2072580 RepID=A0A1W0XC58_HYPEX|nr:hypothetical protein BV898_00789 [Hypsibius exemplaris]